MGEQRGGGTDRQTAREREREREYATLFVNHYIDAHKLTHASTDMDVVTVHACTLIVLFAQKFLLVKPRLCRFDETPETIARPFTAVCAG